MTEVATKASDGDDGLDDICEDHGSKVDGKAQDVEESDGNEGNLWTQVVAVHGVDVSQEGHQ